jgi:hypothetical protein
MSRLTAMGPWETALLSFLFFMIVLLGGLFLTRTCYSQGLCVPTICSVNSECASPGCHCAQPLGSGIGVCA